ncbi:MAG: TonB family protein [Acidobacteriota bacterium]
MGKIVKYCGSCDESFAQKFGFCPICGATLQSFELNPVEAASTEPAKVVTAPAEVAPPLVESVVAEPVAPVFSAPTPLVTEHLAEPEPEIETAPIAAAPVPELTEAQAGEPVKATAPLKPIKAVQAFTAAKAVDIDKKPAASVVPVYHLPVADDGFYVTVIEDKNVGTRNGLLLATFGFMLCALLLGVVISIFSKDVDIGAINGDDLFNAVIAETTPMTVEEEKVKKEKDDGGGGGGGGKNEKTPASKGDLADQSKTPTRPPDVNTPRMENPSLALPPPQTQGTKTFPKIYGKWGDPNGADGNSNGTGSGGGIGSGRGTGQGNGNGTGAGNGNGSGFGNGNGNGNGNGSGDGDDNPPPPKAVGVTQALKILAKPKPSYTDSARQNQVQGTVILRVTFLASGGIGSISPVKGLPNGLTEQAIAAARSMRFEPAKINGVAQNSTKQVEYTFSIY